MASSTFNHNLNKFSMVEASAPLKLTLNFENRAYNSTGHILFPLISECKNPAEISGVFERGMDKT